MFVKLQYKTSSKSLGMVRTSSVLAQIILTLDFCAIDLFDLRWGKEVIELRDSSYDIPIDTYYRSPALPLVTAPLEGVGWGGGY